MPRSRSARRVTNSRLSSGRKPGSGSRSSRFPARTPPDEPADDSEVEDVRMRDLELVTQEELGALDILEQHRLARRVDQDVPRREFLHRHLADEIALGAVRSHVPL